MGSLSPSNDEMAIDALTGVNDVSYSVKDVARLAEVSIATVSRVTNGTGIVSEKTKAKVLSAISMLQYCPNAHAAELGRRNGGISRRHAIHALAVAQREDETDSSFGRRSTDMSSHIQDESLWRIAKHLE